MTSSNLPTTSSAQEHQVNALMTSPLVNSHSQHQASALRTSSLLNNQSQQQIVSALLNSSMMNSQSASAALLNMNDNDSLENTNMTIDSLQQRQNNYLLSGNVSNSNNSISNSTNFMSPAVFMNKCNYLSGSGGDLVSAILMREAEARAAASSIAATLSPPTATRTAAARSLSRVNSTGGSRRNSALGGGITRMHGRANGRISVACILGPQGSEELELTPIEQEHKKRRDKEKMEKRINEMVIGDFY